MAHPIGNQYRADKVMKSRVSPITLGSASAKAPVGIPVPQRATGGAVKAPQRADGGPVQARADKVSRAKGGRVKGTTVNVIVAPKGQDAPAAPAMAAPPPPMPPKPPMPAPAPAPMGAPPVAGLGGMPPIPPRSDGGRAYKRGGRVGKMSGEKKHGKKAGKFKMRASGGAISDSSQGGTKIQHSGNKNDTQNIGRGPVITRATGGPIFADGRKGKQMAWLKGVGAGGGEGRLKKAAHAK